MLINLFVFDSKHRLNLKLQKIYFHLFQVLLFQPNLQRMSSQAAQLKANSERYRNYIAEQFKLLDKGKSAQKIIELIQSFELDAKCQSIDQQLIHYLLIAYIIKGQFLSLKHLIRRYHLDKTYERILQLAVKGANQDLNDFCALFATVSSSIKQKGKSFKKLQTIDQILENAKITFALRTYSKYYINLEIDTVLKMIGCKQNQIQRLGYKIKDKFVQFVDQSPTNPQTQQVLLKKMKNLVTVAEQMSAFQ